MEKETALNQVIRMARDPNSKREYNMLREIIVSILREDGDTYVDIGKTIARSHASVIHIHKVYELDMENCEAFRFIRDAVVEKIYKEEVESGE